MKTTIKNNVLHIEIPLHDPRPSATGRTLTVAGSNGNQPTEARVNGLPVIVGVNCLHQAGELSAAAQIPRRRPPERIMAPAGVSTLPSPSSHASARQPELSGLR